MQSLADILRTVFTDAAPCQMCGKRVPTYHDREKDTHYCFPCLEAAVEEAQAEWLTTPLEDGPEDPETAAMGRAVLAQLLPAKDVRMTA